MSYIPDLDNCIYDDETGTYYDPESGNSYYYSTNGDLWESGNDHAVN